MSLALFPCRKASDPCLPVGRCAGAAASSGAALSARLELHPRGMSAVSAIRLSLGALGGPDRLTEADLRARVRGRFPEAAELPVRPDLDALLEEVGADREWREPPGSEPSYYSRTVSDTGSGTLAVLRYHRGESGVGGGRPPGKIGEISLPPCIPASALARRVPASRPARTTRRLRGARRGAGRVAHGVRRETHRRHVRNVLDRGDRPGGGALDPRRRVPPLP